MDRQKWKKNIIRIIQFLTNPRFLLCFGIAWIITNGWSYIMLGFGTYLEIGWMVAVAGGYLTILWLPISPEKIITVAIAMVLLRWLFPNDKKTLAILKKLHRNAKAQVRRWWRRHHPQKQSAPDAPGEESAAETMEDIPE